MLAVLDYFLYLCTPMTHRIPSILLLLTLSLTVFAGGDTLSVAPKAPQPFCRHDVRIGWGDMIFETLVFHNSPSHQWANPSALPPDYRTTDKSNHRFTGHLFAEYQYYFRHWLSFGAQVDFEGIFWDETPYDRFRNQVGPTTAVRNYNLIILPELRFTYFRSEYVRLHSGLGLGVNVAFDNMRGSAVVPAFNLNFLTVQVGKDHWYGAVELGMLNALNGKQVFMVASRLFSVSVGYTL